ncbi:UDP-glucose 4-epimerase GalE [Shewanella loihica]|nr:UDP-glucose 4-epimerase GalE [Shewanella loihica]
MSILVTGGAGYIGSHACVELLSAGHQLVVLDNLSRAKFESLARVEQITAAKLTFVEGDIRDERTLDALFSHYHIDAVMHFAGLKAVGESTRLPLEYYDNNVVGSMRLLSAMTRHGVKTLVFSSSATVYGANPPLPIMEAAPRSSTNPYGQTKLVVEQMCAEWANAKQDVSVILLRYFNPVGAHESGLIGEDPKGEPNNLLPYITQVAMGHRPYLSVFGSDYATTDGTGVRDYIHVMDLVQGHLAALTRLHGVAGCHTFNLGSGQGYSVLEMVRAFEQASGKDIALHMAPRRPGDIAASYACPDKAARELDWRVARDLSQMMQDSWRWQCRNPRGYS